MTLTNQEKVQLLNDSRLKKFQEVLETQTVVIEKESVDEDYQSKYASHNKSELATIMAKAAAREANSKAK